MIGPVFWLDSMRESCELISISMSRSRPVSEIVFLVEEAPEGGYTAQALGECIYTQGETWEELQAMVRDAVLCHFDEGEAPKLIRLHLVRDEVLAV